MTLHENGRADVVSVSPGPVASSKEEPLTETIIADCPRCAAERAQSRGMAENLETARAWLTELSGYARAYTKYHAEKFYPPGTVIDGCVQLLRLCDAIDGFLAGAPSDLCLSARVRLLEDAISRDEHPAVIRKHVAELVGMLRERGLA